MFDPMVRTGPVVAVARLAFEARIAKGPGVLVLSGNRIDSLQSVVEGGAKGIISFGVAGGLSPELKAGDWVIGARVITVEATIPTDRLWSEQLLRALPGAVYADVSGVDSLAAGEEEKRRLFLSEGTRAVDTESHLVAKIAASHGLRFAVCRVIVDTVHEPLPPAVIAAVRADGTISIAAVLRSLSRRPKQLLAVIRLVRDFTTVYRALIRGRRALGDELGFPGMTDLVPQRLENFP